MPSSRLLALVVAGLLLLFDPGCMTALVWGWSLQPDERVYGPASIESITSASDGAIFVKVRMRDLAVRTYVWGLTLSCTFPDLGAVH
jgi:hypothetical protein